jgi:hypothetical protein
MLLALRPFATAGVVVVSAGLIYVTPVAAPHFERHAVALAAVEDLMDLVNPIDAEFGALTATGESALASVTDALPALTLPDDPLLDPGFWQSFWNLLSQDPLTAWTMLEEAVVQLPAIEPFAVALGVFVVLPLGLLFGYGWSLIADVLGIDTYPAAAEGLASGLPDVYDGAVAGVIDPALSAGVTDIAPLFSDLAGALDPTTLVQDLSTAWDPSALASAFDLNAMADIGAVLSTSTIPDLGEILTSLIP